MFLKSIAHSWSRHLGLQLATLSVLSASFAAVTFGLLLSFNMQRVLSQWGDSIQITAYLKEDLNANEMEKAQSQIQALSSVKEVVLIDQVQATNSFKNQMASYAPGLLNDHDFANPFPASFKVTLKNSDVLNNDPQVLAKMAEKIRGIYGVEEVTYGQGWVKNYAVFAKALRGVGKILGLILFLGSLLIVGNSVRSAVSSRREEIEILELVGATRSTIRAPYIFEGALMGFLASAFAITINFLIFHFGMHSFGHDLNFTRLTDLFTFLDPVTVAGVLFGGTLLGSIGAFLAVRVLNHGWAASQGSHS